MRIQGRATSTLGAGRVALLGVRLAQRTTRLALCRSRIVRRASVDWTGRNFGDLTVLRKVGKDQYYVVIYECRCSCGLTTQVLAANLRSGNSRSCGIPSRHRQLP